MYATILDRITFQVKDLIEYESYYFGSDIDFATKSWVQAAKKPEVAENDFVLCWDNEKMAYTGICESFDSSSDNYEYKINLKEAENLFDRKIIPDDTTEQIISGARTDSTYGKGIEAFIARIIANNWINSGDSKVDMPNIAVTAATHTNVQATINTISELQNGVYNLKTFLGNAKQNYGIYLTFAFTNGRLTITIRRKAEAAVPVDIETSDISSYKETYDVNAIAKLNVKWVIPEQVSGDEVLQIGTFTLRTFYLLTDRTISENKNAMNRAEGTVSAVVIETDDEEEMKQNVLDEFKQNSYKHQVTFDLRKGTKLYNTDDLYVGRLVTMKTKTGVRSTIITGRSESSESAYISLTFGNLKITLIEKLRGLR